jgi:hypothetical protein
VTDAVAEKLARMHQRRAIDEWVRVWEEEHGKREEEEEEEV